MSKVCGKRQKEREKAKKERGKERGKKREENREGKKERGKREGKKKGEKREGKREKEREKIVEVGAETLVANYFCNCFSSSPKLFQISSCAFTLTKSTLYSYCNIIYAVNKPSFS
jgi:hypothetical protein